MRRTMVVLAAALVGVTLAAAAAELVVRLAFGEQVKFASRLVEAPWGLRMNAPGAVYRLQSPDARVEVRIDGQGFRADRDHPRAKPAGVKRIVSLGDSFALGAGVEREATFSSVLEAELRKAGQSVEVLNAGVPGFGTAEECLYLERDLFDYDPDLVLVSFRASDLAENTRSDLLRLDDRKLVPGRSSYAPGLLLRSPLLDFVAERSDAWALLRERIAGRAETVAQKDDPELFPMRRLAAAIFDRIYRDCRGRRIPLVIQSIPAPDPEHPGELVDSFPDEFDARREGVVLVSAAAALAPQVGRETLYNVHSHQHWTPLAHRLAGEALARVILEQHLLGPAASGPKPARP